MIRGVLLTGRSEARRRREGNGKAINREKGEAPVLNVRCKGTERIFEGGWFEQTLVLNKCRRFIDKNKVIYGGGKQSEEKGRKTVREERRDEIRSVGMREWVREHKGFRCCGVVTCNTSQLSHPPSFTPLTHSHLLQWCLSILAWITKEASFMLMCVNFNSFYIHLCNFSLLKLPWNRILLHVLHLPAVDFIYRFICVHFFFRCCFVLLGCLYNVGLGVSSLLTCSDWLVLSSKNIETRLGVCVC